MEAAAPELPHHHVTYLTHHESFFELRDQYNYFLRPYCWATPGRRFNSASNVTALAAHAIRIKPRLAILALLLHQAVDIRLKPGAFRIERAGEFEVIDNFLVEHFSRN